MIKRANFPLPVYSLASIQFFKKISTWLTNYPELGVRAGGMGMEGRERGKRDNNIRQEKVEPF